MSAKSSPRLLLTGAVLAAMSACVESPELDESASELTASYKASVKNRVLSIIGTSAASRLTLRLGATPSTLVVDVGDDGTADFTFDRSTFERISIDAGGGDDVVTMSEVAGGFTTEEQITINGGGGKDTLTGGVGPETFLGGAGDDLVSGGGGNDTIALGGGNDVVIWNPGGGSDVIDGGDGIDRFQFNLANIGEQVAATAVGDHVRLTRDVALIALDLHGLEVLDVAARGGADQIVVNDLTAALVDQVNVDLSSGVVGQGDAAADTVVFENTPVADNVNVWADGGAVVVAGSSTEVRIAGGEPALDQLVVNGDATDHVNLLGSAAADAMTAFAAPSGVAYRGFGYGVAIAPSPAAATTVFGLGGDDVLDAGSGIVTGLVFDGGDGNDQLRGGQGPDRLLGGPGNDVVDGGIGADTAMLGDGDDTYVWDPGDASDVIEGEAGRDALVFNASNANDTIELRAAADRVHLTRDIGASTTDLGGVERIEVHARAGSDRIVIDPLTGTPATQVDVDLSGSDAVVDSVVLNGTPGVGAIAVAAAGDAVAATGLGVTVNVRNGEQALDRMTVTAGALTVDGTAGADTMIAVADAGGVAYGASTWSVLATPGGATPTTLRGLDGDDVMSASSAITSGVSIDGGPGADTIQGSSGPDLLVGGPGADVIDGNLGADTVRLGDGDDTFVWDPGDASDVVDGDLGTDALVFHASNAGEAMELRASGARASLLRSIGAVTMDLGGFERIAIGARGSADSLAIGDLTGTPITRVDVDLAGIEGSGTGDAATDVVTVLGSSQGDAITIAPDAGAVRVTGLAAEVRITGEELIDQLVVSGGGGVDSFTIAPGIGMTLITSQD
ncbi:MAG: hypothetical protein K8W52_25895 [Deltaproteobacteria bacterium]|nr:hypothetical protein [Deltaproteobacteria bacterium]